MTASPVRRREDDDALDLAIARLLTLGTYAAVALLAAGVVVLVGEGHSPLEGGPRFDPAGLVGDLVALRADAFLWLGLVAVVLTPAARVAAALVGYVRGGEVRMAVISALILGIIVLSVLLGTGAEA